MIESLVGEIAFRMSDRVVVSVAGVGYGVTMLPTELAVLEKGHAVELAVYTMVKEDTLKLFGFMDMATKELFEVLLGFSGVGPKIALAILTVLPGQQLLQVVHQDDLAALQSVPGIGRRTAEKMMLELRNRIEKLSAIFASMESVVTSQVTSVNVENPLKVQVKQDLSSALENLGFRGKDIKRVLDSFGDGDEGFTELMRKALAELTPGAKGSRQLECHA